ncbi:hypothetical protein LZ31DRAFT_275142 [Colletotrichum somersetense]|nr:hypothetical protein LZ31DRAFT_275142 [Colletotrichum somersetense]
MPPLAFDRFPGPCFLASLPHPHIVCIRIQIRISWRGRPLPVCQSVSFLSGMILSLSLLSGIAAHCHQHSIRHLLRKPYEHGTRLRNANCHVHRWECSSDKLGHCTAAIILANFSISAARRPTDPGVKWVDTTAILNGQWRRGLDAAVSAGPCPSRARLLLGNSERRLLNH